MRPLTLFLTLCLLVPLTALGQTRRVQNRPYIDQRRLHYGFLAGVHMQDIEMEHSGAVAADGKTWYADAASYEPGFSVGVLAELRLNSHIALRAIPSMHFGTKNVTFRPHPEGESVLQTVKSTYISLPLDLKFSAERFNNYRPYVVAGLNPMYDLTVKRGRPLLLRKFDCYAEIGLGCDFYLPFFKCIPEIKFAYGLTNIVEKHRNDITDPTQLVYSSGINSGRSKMIILTLYFE